MFAGLSLADLDRDPRSAAIGVDVGGTKTALGLIDAASLTLLACDVIATRPERGGEAVLADVAKHAAALARAAARQDRRVVGVGVAVPEVVSLAGRISSSAVIPRWNELPVAATLGTIAPTVLEADVRAAAFAEASLGAGRPYAWHVFLTVGTGISYCAVGDGRPLAGAHGGALNVGTTVLDLGADRTACDPAGSGPADGEYGRDGHVLERIASGSALVQRFNQRGGSARGAGEVLAAARLGDRAARDVVDAGANALGVGIALLINLLDPQAAQSIAFGTFWMYVAFRSIPRSLSESALIDGASPLSLLWRILVPNVGPAVKTMAALVFLWTWNAFLLPLVMVSNQSLYTVTVGLSAFQGAHFNNYAALAAGSCLAALPVVVVYLFAQRSFIAGLFAGSLVE